MTKVVEVPGVGEVEFPDSMSDEQIVAAIEGLRNEEQPGPSSIGTFMREMGSRTANTALESPRIVGDLFALGAAGAGGAASMIRGKPPEFGQRFRDNQSKLPASLLRAIPSPTVQDIGAGMSSLPALMPGGKSFGEEFQDQKSRIISAQTEEREANPWSAFAGQLAGDVFSLIGLKAPFAQKLGRAEEFIDPRRAEIAFGRAASSSAQSNLRFLLDKTVTSGPMRRLYRGMGRSGETAFDAAVLEIMNEEDPMATAAFAAGGQMVGSAVNQTAKESVRAVFSGSVPQIGLKLAGAAIAVGSIWQMAKTATPGGEDSFVGSIESGYDKVLWSIALGTLAAGAGAGRLRGREFADRFPKVADGISTIPRASMISLLEDMADADPATQQQMELVLNTAISSPETFSVREAQRLQNAIARGKFASTLGNMMESESFREKVFNLAPPKLNDGQD